MNDAEHHDRMLMGAVLGLFAASGAVADVLKKHRYHGHPMDWALLMTLAEAARVEAGNVALIAERAIERAQEDGNG